MKRLAHPIIIGVFLHKLYMQYEYDLLFILRERWLLKNLLPKKSALNEANESLAAQIEAQSMGKEDSEERRVGLAEMNKLDEIVKEIDIELKRHEDNDPEVINQLKIEYMQAKGDCNRWTGIFVMVHTFI